MCKYFQLWQKANGNLFTSRLRLHVLVASSSSYAVFQSSSTQSLTSKPQTSSSVMKADSFWKPSETFRATENTEISE